MCSVKCSVVSMVSYEVKVCFCVVRSFSVGCCVVRNSSVGCCIVEVILSNRPSQLHLVAKVKDYFRSSELNLPMSSATPRTTFHAVLIMYFYMSLNLSWLYS